MARRGGARLTCRSSTTDPLLGQDRPGPVRSEGRGQRPARGPGRRPTRRQGRRGRQGVPVQNEGQVFPGAGQAVGLQVRQAQEHATVDVSAGPAFPVTRRDKTIWRFRYPSPTYARPGFGNFFMYSFLIVFTFRAQ